MENDLLWQRLTRVFTDVFQATGITLAPETTAEDIAQWDSLNHIKLILAVEAAFKIRFKNAEVVGFQNVGDLVNCLRSHLDIDKS